MSKKYKNHIFQRATMPWRWLAIVSFVIALVTSVSAFITARDWVSDGKYLQSIDIEQIEVLRLIPALKVLQSQTSSTVGLEPSFFNNLKKSDGLFKSITDDVKLPVDAPATDSGSAKSPAMNSASPAQSADTAKLATLSDNPALAFFQKLDAKIMKVVFGKPDKYAHLAEEKLDASEVQAADTKSSKVASVQDVLLGAKRAEQAMGTVLAQEKSLAGLGILAKSAEALLSPKGVLDLDKISSDSPAKKYAESLNAFLKANDAWQKNITDAASTSELQKALGTVIDQKVLLEIELGKKVSGKSPPKLNEVMTKVHQTPWHTKLPQESALAIKLYSTGMTTIRDFASSHEALRVVAQQNSQDLGFFDFKTAGGFLGLTIVSVVGILGFAIGGFMFSRNTNLNALDLQRTSKVASAADELLSSIDLGFANAPSMKAMDPPKSEPQPVAPQRAPQPATDATSPELKTVVNVISELSGDLKQKISDIERRFKLLSQLSNKLRHSVNTLQDKAAQIRPADSGGNEQAYSGSTERASRVGPLDQLQDAFFALKQQGVRLYLAILDNHSSKQLAVETEQLNLLVDRVEATVSKMRGSLAIALEQAAATEQFAPEISLEAIELLGMDAKQVIRDLDSWEEEFDGLGQEFSDLKRQAKT
ncbi:MAG: hypothetical protein B7Y67_12140 [Polynucleobacter sp. 35-46-11]|uniref:hypothetical protein n=1 Tax=Polynucleobacter sp. 35-46-11 TaxID=1970425 RepID=UPI000BCB218C|nr:hypothetical protein [Polynucleobacter sp. 35-46-11]OYY13608.1 MAG: hypothetical protein B7Y67_12140 [Polynucleobacter sp. 35-46-11]